MTVDNILRILSAVGYSAAFFLVLMCMFLNMFFLYDDAVNKLSLRTDTDMAWLYLLTIPVELCVAVMYFYVMVPYIFV